MTAHVLFAARPERWASYEAPLRAALAERGVEVHLSCNLPSAQVEYIVYAPNSEVQDFSCFPRLKAVLNLWAGVETVAGNQTLTVPLARMVDSGLTDGMVEWVSGHVLRHHLGMDAHIVNPERTWSNTAPPLARERVVTVLGLGELGMACARMLSQFGFHMRGWARSQKSIEGVACFSGEAGLTEALSGADIVVLLLPQTAETQNLMNAERLSYLSQGAFVINPGRGPLIDDAALLAALDRGQVAHATLDVFRTEPLPQDHPFWAHPQVTVTPHIASETRVVTASACIAENIMRGEQGLPFLHLVDRSAGY